MKTKNTSDYRDEVMTHLKYIKEKVDENHTHLLQLNGRVRKTEISISWIKGIGTTLTFIIGIIFSWLKLWE